MVTWKHLLIAINFSQCRFCRPPYAKRVTWITGNTGSNMFSISMRHAITSIFIESDFHYTKSRSGKRYPRYRSTANVLSRSTREIYVESQTADVDMDKSLRLPRHICLTDKPWYTKNCNNVSCSCPVLVWLTSGLLFSTFGIDVCVQYLSTDKQA